MRITCVRVSVAMTLAIASGCTRSKAEITPLDSGPPPVTSAAPAPADPTMALATQLGAATSWREAFALVRPRIQDVKNLESNGEMLFAVWASRRLYWADVAVATNETSVAKVLKDSENERGRRACAGGTLIQITVDRSVTPPAYEGLFQTDAGGLLKFIAVGDTGELVANSYARFCGIVAGAYDYDNSAGGVGHAVAMVGMFDLPENRKRVAPAPQEPPPIAVRPATKAPPLSTDACCSALSKQRAALGLSPESDRLDAAVSACARNAGPVAVSAALLGITARPAACLSL